MIGYDDVLNRYIIGNYIVDRTVGGNSYGGNETIIAGYGMFIYQLTPLLKFIGGAEQNTLTSVYPVQTPAKKQARYR